MIVIRCLSEAQRKVLKHGKMIVKRRMTREYLIQEFIIDLQHLESPIPGRSDS